MTGDLARQIWTLADVAKGIRVTGYMLRASNPPGLALQVIAAALPLKPGQRYQLSLSHGGGRDTPGFAGGFAAGTRILTEVIASARSRISRSATRSGPMGMAFSQLSGMGCTAFWRAGRPRRYACAAGSWGWATIC